MQKKVSVYLAVGLDIDRPCPSSVLSMLNDEDSKHTGVTRQLE